MKLLENTPLAPYTSLKIGGPAERLHIAETTDELVELLPTLTPPTVLGYGCNVLISDEGLPGDTILIRSSATHLEETTLVADAGVWWDNLVQDAIAHNLWGLELTSEIPSSVGAAVFGNIAAYGQQVSDTLAWVEVYDRTTQQITQRPASEFSFGYRSSSFQQQPHLSILRAAFTLHAEPTHELRYDSAVAIADELDADIATLEGRRACIIETRRRAGSLYHPDDTSAERSAGSFFKNPLVSTEQAIELARFDESGKTLERIENQSRIHGGDSHRASAAHVLLAAGFHRGQTWGPVSLHHHHVLKIVTHEGATASQVHAVVTEILTAVKEKLDINLEPEVKFFGAF